MNTDKKRKFEGEDTQPAKKLKPDDISPFLQPPTPMGLMPSNPANLIPTHSAWFKLDQVSDIEQRAFSEFFNSKNPAKTPEIYKQIRDFIVQAYRSAPGTYLTVTDCRKVLTGDVGSIMRIHAFLEHWGIINYAIDPKSKPTQNPFILAQLQQQPIIHDYVKEPSTVSERLVMFGSKTKIPISAMQQQQTDWTDEETLKLLDAVDKYKENWDAISKYVGKPKEQCITHFLQMPIEEQFLQPSVELPVAVNEDGTPKLDQPLPFADATNPVMAMVAFLASVVDPSVAAAAAQAALESIKGKAAEQGETNFDVSKLDVKTASAAALGAAVERAKVLASKEERDIQRYVAYAIDQQVKKLDAKLKYFEELEALLQNEREQVEQIRQSIVAERDKK